MVDPSTTYKIGRMSAVVEHAWRKGESMWLVCVNRRQSERFVGTSAVAWCDTNEAAQALARMLAGVEITREGAAIWPDGRTEPADMSGQNKAFPDVLLHLVSALDAALDQIERDAAIIPEDDADKSHRLTTINLGRAAIAKVRVPNKTGEGEL